MSKTKSRRIIWSFLGEAKEIRFCVDSFSFPSYYKSSQWNEVYCKNLILGFCGMQQISKEEIGLLTNNVCWFEKYLAFTSEFY